MRAPRAAAIQREGRVRRFFPSNRISPSISAVEATRGWPGRARSPRCRAGLARNAEHLTSFDAEGYVLRGMDHAVAGWDGDVEVTRF